MGVTTRTQPGSPALGQRLVNVNSASATCGAGAGSSPTSSFPEPGTSPSSAPRTPTPASSPSTRRPPRPCAGVDLVVTGADTTADTGPLFLLWDLPGQRSTQTRCLADGTVRWVGEAVAAVVAADRATAEDALELIEVDYEPLAAVSSTAEALAAGSVVLYGDWPDNIVHTNAWVGGDAAAALARADLVVTETFHSGRLHGLPLETRSVVAAARRRRHHRVDVDPVAPPGAPLGVGIARAAPAPDPGHRPRRRRWLRPEGRALRRGRAGPLPGPPGGPAGALDRGPGRGRRGQCPRPRHRVHRRDGLHGRRDDLRPAGPGRRRPRRRRRLGRHVRAVGVGRHHARPLQDRRRRHRDAGGRDQQGAARRLPGCRPGRGQLPAGTAHRHRGPPARPRPRRAAAPQPGRRRMPVLRGHRAAPRQRRLHPRCFDMVLDGSTGRARSSAAPRPGPRAGSSAPAWPATPKRTNFGPSRIITADRHHARAAGTPPRSRSNPTARSGCSCR